MTDLLERLFCLFQYLLPHHLISRLVGYLARSRVPAIRNNLIRLFIRKYGVDMSLAEIEDPEAYEDFNAFFTRALKPGMRPVCDGELDIASPADGVISQLGVIRGADVLQAKGHYFSLYELFGGHGEVAREFVNGSFATVYLSPKDYHRVHMPLTGTLREMIYVPGRLFSVNHATARGVNGLFARNERAVCVFDTAHGPMAVVLVGAMIVAGIETVFSGPVTPLSRHVRRIDYAAGGSGAITLQKGDELGRFHLGSTAIVLLPEDSAIWLPGLDFDSPVSVGQKIGEVRVRGA